MKRTSPAEVIHCASTLRGFMAWALASLLLALPAWASELEVPADNPGQATTKPAAAETVKPGMFWGTVIRRDEFSPLTGKQRWGLYWRQTYWTPGAFFRAAGPALGAHLDNDPPQWGQGAAGYSRRFADRFARSTIQDSIEAAAAAALEYDVRYVRCGCRGFFPRLGHAITWNFLTLDRKGRKVFDAPLVGSAFAAEFIGNTWLPKGHRSAADAMRGVGVELGIGVLFNTIREFVPARKGK
jgi:hypothetical protein